MRTIQITLKLVITGLVLLAQQALLAQGATCATSTILCNPNASFPANTSVASLGSVNCLTTTPNPSFFTLNIAQGGDLHLLTTNSASIDIDFAIWGLLLHLMVIAQVVFLLEHLLIVVIQVMPMKTLT